MKRLAMLALAYLSAVAQLGIGWTWGLGIDVPIWKLLVLGLVYVGMTLVLMVAERLAKIDNTPKCDGCKWSDATLAGWEDRCPICKRFPIDKWEGK